MSKLILGTASFGIPNYGIKRDGQPSEQEIEKISRVAWDGGIRTIHTSWEYNLPKICDAIFEGFDRIEKCKDNPQEFIYENDYGYSIYDNTEIVSNGLYTFIQIPVNILDNRFLKKDWDIPQIHARSVFLQGLLLMDIEELPNFISTDGKRQIIRFHQRCNIEGIERYEAALGWVLGLDEIDNIIVGVNSAKQLEELLAVKPLKWDYDFSIQDENVLDPRRWPQ